LYRFEIIASLYVKHVLIDAKSQALRVAATALNMRPREGVKKAEAPRASAFCNALDLAHV
jgi:hypothetical protein